MSANRVWEKCLDFIRENVPQDVFDAWFRPIKPVALKGDVLYIEVPTNLYYEWLETHYLELLRAALKKNIGPNARLKYLVRMTNKPQGGTSHLTYPGKQSPRVDTRNYKPHTSKEIKSPFVVPGVEKIRIDSQLNPNYTFENFIEGPNNRLAVSAGKSIAKFLGNTSFNPLFIYGGVGLGKTHLANAIGIEVKRLHPEKNVLYVSTEKFTQQYTSAVVNNTRDDFIHFYQMIDVLIVDDVQFLAGKTGVQKVFFQIFNHLHLNKKQLIFTSDKAPVDMRDVEVRLLSRFKWGLAAELKSPDFETRRKIIRFKLEQDGVQMDDAVVDYIARHVRSNVREIEGILTSMIAQSAFNHKPLDLNLAKEVIGNFVSHRKPVYTCDMIQKIVAEYFNLDVEDIQSKSRRREIVQARQISMYLSKKYTDSPLEEIGSRIGKRNHATVIYALKTVKNLMDVDKRFRQQVLDLEKTLTGL